MSLNFWKILVFWKAVFQDLKVLENYFFLKVWNNDDFCTLSLKFKNMLSVSKCGLNLSHCQPPVSSIGLQTFPNRLIGPSKLQFDLQCSVKVSLVNVSDK